MGDHETGNSVQVSVLAQGMFDFVSYADPSAQFSMELIYEGRQMERKERENEIIRKHSI